MRKRFDPQLTLGAIPIEKVHIEPRPRDELPGVLKGLQWIFKTDEVNEEIFKLLEEKIVKDKQETGRAGMDLWRVLVLGVLKDALDIDFSRLEDLANNHRLIRQIMGLNGFVDSDEEKFNYQTICDNVNLIDAELLEKINMVVAREGRELFFKKGREEGIKIKTDGYVLESNVHFPTDINLLWDSVRKSLDLTEKFLERWEVSGWRKMSDWRKKLKYAKIGLERAKRGGGRNKEERVVPLVKNYLEIANSLEEKIFRTIEELRLKPLLGCNLLHLICLEDFHGMLMHHWLLVHDRLVEGKVIEHSDKYFSLFERHTEWINKGKAGYRVELGHNILISSDENRLILDYEVLTKKSEKEGLLDSTERLMKNYDERLASLSVDKGFYVVENKELLEECIGEVCMPKPGKKSKKQIELESCPEFIKLRRAHSEIESVINSLGHHGLNRCYGRGLDGFERYVGYGVLAYNLHQIGNQLYKIGEEKRERLKRKRERERRRRSRLKEAA